jgi:hypothetical protein
VAAYDCDRKTAATYAGRNIRRAHFLAELPAQSPEAKREFNLFLWLCLRGEHPLHPGDVRLMITAAKILAALIYPRSTPRKPEAPDMEDFEGRSVAELEHYARTGVWLTSSRNRQ